MRGAPQARSSRLAITIGDLPRPSWPRSITLRRRQITGEELELIERLSSERRRERRSGGYRPDVARQRVWR
jgi:hypothetical protein